MGEVPQQRFIHIAARGHPIHYAGAVLLLRQTNNVPYSLSCFHNPASKLGTPLHIVKVDSSKIRSAAVYMTILAATFQTTQPSLLVCEV